MKGVFVTGTDTDVGKTVISSLLSYFLAEYTAVNYFKPIQAGTPTDLEFVKDICSDKHDDSTVGTHPSRNTLSLDKPCQAVQQKYIRIEFSSFNLMILQSNF